VPVRPQPTAISSAIRCTPNSSQRAQPRAYDGSCIAMPAAHCTSGSTISAAICPARSANRRRTSPRALRDVGGRLARLRAARIGRGDHVRVADQRVVRILEQRDVGHAERADRLAVIAAGDAHEFALVPLAAIAPRVEAHLQRDLDGRCAVRREERVAERARGERMQPLGEFDRRLVRAAGEHRVLERVELVLQRGVDVRIRMAEQVHPPRADRVE
jgi:hypothetical protein